MRIQCWLATLFLALVSGTATAADVIQDVLDAWARREQSVKSLRVEWVTTSVDFPIIDKNTFQEADTPTLFTREHELLVSGNRVKYREHSIKHRGYETWAIDGNTNTFLDYPGVRNDQRYPYATIRKWGREETVDAAWLYHRQPPLALYRMLALSGFDRSSFLGKVREEKLDDRRVVVLTRRLLPRAKPDPFAPSANNVIEYWLDPERDYALVRNVHNSGNGKLFNHVYVTYTEGPGDDWELKSWATLSFSGRGTFAEVRKIEVNPSLPENELKIHMPSGTVVSDSVAGQMYMVCDGTQRIPIDRKKAFSYTEILKRIKTKSH